MYDAGDAQSEYGGVVLEIRRMAKERHNDCLKEIEELERQGAQLEVHRKSLNVEAAMLGRIMDAAQGANDPRLSLGQKEAADAEMRKYAITGTAEVYNAKAWSG